LPEAGQGLPQLPAGTLGGPMVFLKLAAANASSITDASQHAEP
jgi:hypothetical protein